MFHRVKSEAENKTEQQKNEQPATQATSAQQAVAQAQRSAQSPYRSSQFISDSAPVASYVQEKISMKKEEEQVKTEADNKPEEAAVAEPAQPAYSTTPAASYSAPSAQVSSYQRPTSSSQSSSADNDRRLTIGRGITMSGEIESCDELHVEGTVEAALKGASHLNIAESGVFYGTVEIQDAIIAGRFEGDLVVKGRLTVEETGIITGSISYAELEVSTGAIIDGRITPLSSHVPAKQAA